MNNCPDDSDLHRYHAGEMDDGEAGRVREHLASCESCAKRDAAIVSEHEDLVRHVRDLKGTFGLDDDACSPGGGSQQAGRSQPGRVSAGEELIGQSIGPYRLLEVLGEGGFGVVYLAEQVKPIRRHVALKILKPGMDTKRVVARFEAERQALAMMDHPNVAKVFDAGATEQGLPYFAMEHVPGVAITDYCDRHLLGTAERLGLFIQVCVAVQHAHQKGIIHRDIKPSNVLVSVRDNRPVPMVIDFGVAKAISRPLTEQTLFTEQGQLIGTPEYMSPEQAEMTGLNVDTRTDIYSLGVLLYGLLAGTLPFDPKCMRRAGYAEIQRIIREDDPPKPSTRLSSLGGESITVAHNRHTDPPSLISQLRGDLDWITMRAMEKDRTRRYSSASEMAADIERHLNHEPVLASPPSMMYRARKFVRRHRIGVVASAVVGLTLVLGIVGTTTMAVVASRRGEAASRARAEAERAAGTTRLINLFLTDMLRAADPFTNASGGVPSDASVVDLLDDAAKKLPGAFTEHVEVEAGIRAALGTTYHGLSILDKAEDHLSRALELRGASLGLEHVDTLQSRQDWARLLISKGELQEAEQACRDVLEVKRRVFGEEHPDTLTSLNDWGTAAFLRGNLPDAEHIFRECLEGLRRSRGSQHRDTLLAMNNLGQVLNEQGNATEARLLLRECLASCRRSLGKLHPDTIGVLNNLATLEYREKDLVEAEHLFNEVVESYRETLGSDHLNTLAASSNLALIYHALGRLDEAESLFRATLDIQRRVLPKGHMETLRTLNNLALLLEDRGAFEEAGRAWEAAARGFEEALGADHPSTVTVKTSWSVFLREQGQLPEAEALLRTLVGDAGTPVDQLSAEQQSATYWLGKVCLDQGKLAEAEAAFRRLLESRRSTLGTDHEDTINAMAWLVSVLTQQRKFADAKTTCRELIEARSRSLGPEHVDTLNAMSRLAGILHDLEEYQEAETLARRVTDARLRTLGPEHADTLQSMNDLALLLKDRGKVEEAEHLYREVLELETRTLGRKNRHTLISLLNLATLLRDSGRQDEAAVLLAELVDAAEETLGAEHRYIGIFLSAYGKCLVQTKELSAAEARLLAGHDALLRSFGENHDRTTKVRQSLVELYETWGKPEKAAQWRARMPWTSQPTSTPDDNAEGTNRETDRNKRAHATTKPTASQPAPGGE
ncbi:MAG: tetratricopeptide repeat protein [Planctomycetota bacterium]